MPEETYIECTQCPKGVLLPFSDYLPSGGEQRFKAWACSNPECGFCVKIHNGSVGYGTVTPRRREE